MNQINKILFPFYKERHHFLFIKWWYRLLLIIYPIILITVSFYLFSEYISSYLSCYDTVIKVYDMGSNLYNQEFAFCKENVMRNIPLAIGYSFLVTATLHYLIQALFFKITIDFIALGKSINNKKFSENMSNTTSEKNKKGKSVNVIIVAILIFILTYKIVQIVTGLLVATIFMSINADSKTVTDISITTGNAFVFIWLVYVVQKARKIIANNRYNR